MTTHHAPPTAPEATTATSPQNAEVRAVREKAQHIAADIRSNMEHVLGKKNAKRKSDKILSPDIALEQAIGEKLNEKLAEAYTTLALEKPGSREAENAKEAYVQQLKEYARKEEILANQMAEHPDSWRNARDKTIDLYKNGKSFLKRHAKMTLTAVGATAYAMGAGSIVKTGNTFLGLAQDTTLGYLMSVPTVGAAGLLGYGLGKLAGKGIDILAKKWSGSEVGAEKIGKYAGMLAGTFGTAGTIGVAASTVFWTAGIPLGLLGVWKLGKMGYRLAYPAPKLDREAIAKEAHIHHVALPIERASHHLQETYKLLHGDENDVLIKRLKQLQDDAHHLLHPESKSKSDQSKKPRRGIFQYLNDQYQSANDWLNTRVYGENPEQKSKIYEDKEKKKDNQEKASKKIPPTLGDLEAEWAILKPEAEEAIKKLQQRANELAPERAQARSLKAQCKAMRDSWMRLKKKEVAEKMIKEGTFEKFSDSLEAVFSGTEATITEFIEKSSTQYTFQAVKDAFATAESKFKEAWDKELKNESEGKEAGRMKAEIEQLKKEWETLNPEKTSKNPELDTAIARVEKMYDGFKDKKFLFEAVKTAYDKAKTLFDTGSTKVYQRTDSDIELYKTKGEEIFNEIDASFKEFNEKNEHNPAALQAYSDARKAHSAAKIANGNLKRALKPEDAANSYKKMQDQQEIVAEKIQTAKANLNKADQLAKQALEKVSKLELDKEPMNALRALPKYFKNLQKLVDKQAREVAAAANENKAAVWDTNKDSFFDTKVQIVKALKKWSEAHPSSEDAEILKDEVEKALIITKDKDEKDVKKMELSIMHSLLNDYESRLKHIAQESMASLKEDLAALQTVAGEGAGTIALLMERCDKPEKLPSRGDFDQILKQYKKN